MRVVRNVTVDGVTEAFDLNKICYISAITSDIYEPNWFMSLLSVQPDETHKLTILIDGRFHYFWTSNLEELQKARNVLLGLE